MKVLIVDGNNLVCAGYFVSKNYPEKLIPMQCADYFNNRVSKIEQQLGCDATYVAWDGINSTAWRKTIFPDYKGTRKEKEPMLYECLNYVPDNNIFKNIKVENAEGDDTIYALCRYMTETGNSNYILSHDNDMIQIVQEKLSKGVYTHIKNTFKSIPDYDIAVFKSLMGDTSDNLHGLMGIGEKKAIKLIENNLAGLTGEQIQLFRKHKQVIRLANNPYKDNFLNTVKQYIVSNS